MQASRYLNCPTRTCVRVLPAGYNRVVWVCGCVAPAHVGYVIRNIQRWIHIFVPADSLYYI